MSMATTRLCAQGGMSALSRRADLTARVVLSGHAAALSPVFSRLRHRPLYRSLGSTQLQTARFSDNVAPTTSIASSDKADVSADDFRRVFRLVASSVWIITSSAQSQPVGFTAISVASVSLDPPMLSFNISKTSSSLSALSPSQPFAVHLLPSDEDAVSLAQLFARKPSEARFRSSSSWKWDERRIPHVNGSVARLTCTVAQMVNAGDSWLVLGLVDGIRNQDGMPLLHHAGAFRPLPPTTRPTPTITKISSPINGSTTTNSSTRLSVAMPFASGRTNGHVHLAAMAGGGRGFRTFSSSSSSSASSSPTLNGSKRRMYLNAFDMACSGGHQCPGVWTHPADQSHRYKDLSYWTELAQLLDRGGFDTLFLADVLGAYDVYQGSRDAAVLAGAQMPVNEPTLAIPAMAAVTKRLCFAATVCLTYEQPYSFARRMSTLDHLTKGRIAWNIVTSYLESAAVNLGLDTQIPHDERYDIAEEYMAVCYKLWEASWEDDAVLRDKQRRIFALPEKVHDINHKGKYFKVPGAHLCEPSPQRTPVLFQAGASRKGKAFAARHAEGVFVISLNTKHCRQITSAIRKQAAEFGRDPASIKIYALMTVVVDETDEKAQAKLAEYKQHASIEGAMAMYGGWTGIDLSTVDLDAPLEYVENDSLRSVGEMLKASDSSVQWTARRVAEWIGIGAVGPVVVGSPTTVVDELERWMDEGDLDGFNLPYVITPSSFVDFTQLVIPELRKRNRMPPAAVEGGGEQGGKTMREALGGAGPRLSDDHPGASYRKQWLRDSSSEQSGGAKRESQDLRTMA